MNRVICGTLLATLCAAMLGCSGASGAGGKTTPEATFESFQSAMKSKDYKTAFQQVTPESQDMMLGPMSMAIGVIALEPENGAEAKRIIEKHGLKPIDLGMLMSTGNSPDAAQKMMADVASDVKDKPACLADVIALVEKSSSKKPDGKAESTAFEHITDAKLTDVKIEGDVAHGKIMSTDAAGKATSLPAKFRKIDGVWLIEFEMPSDADPPPSFGQPLDSQLPPGNDAQFPDVNNLVPGNGATSAPQN